jgi:hypothetical protein
VAPSSGIGQVNGRVQFFDNGSAIGMARLMGGQATFRISNLSVGTTANPTHTITAQYIGNDNFAATTPPLPSVTETVKAANTLTLLTIWKNPVALGDPVTLIARVSPNLSGVVTTGGPGWHDGWGDDDRFGSGPQSPSGQVEFLATDINGIVTDLGPGTLKHGVAMLRTSALPAGTSTIMAVYAGDGNYNGSTSQAVAESVDSTLSGSRIKVTASRPAVVNTPVTFSVAVNAKRWSTATTSTSDTVTFVDATVSTSTPLTGSPVNLDALGKATFTATFTTPGLHLIIATYTPASGSGLAASQMLIPVYVWSTAPTGWSRR